jgi:hypothetical protein
MESINYIREIVAEQERTKRKVPVDIRMVNGNILLRSFHILEFDERENLVKGLTQQEEYSYPREGRSPEYCYLFIHEIKEITDGDIELQRSIDDEIFI